MTDKTPLEKGFLEPEEALQAIRDGKYTVNELAAMEEAGEVEVDPFSGQRISLGELYKGLGDLPLAEMFAPLTVATTAGENALREAAKQLTIPEDLLGELRKAAEFYSSVKPFLDILAEAYPRDAAFNNQPLLVVLTPINLYMQDNWLFSAMTEEIAARKEDFLAFFATYLAELEAANALNREPTDEALSEILSRILLEEMPKKGFLGRIGGNARDAAELAGVVRKADEELQEYSKILQTHAFLNLATVNTKRTPIVFDNLTKQAKANGKGITVLDSRIISQKEKDAEIKSAFEKTLTKINNLTALKVLDLYRMEQANTRPYGNPSTRFRLNVMDYMKKCDIKMTPESYKRTQRRLIEVARAWYEVSISLEDEGEARAARLLQEKAESKGGYIEYWFTERLAGYLAKGYISHYHLSLLRTDERNPNAFFIGNKLQLHYGILSNHERGTECIISVKSLTEELETKGTLPTFEEVKAGKRQYTQRIVRPFEAALNSVEFLDKWEYCNARKKPLTKAQKARFTYATFAGCYIKFALKDPPDLTQALRDKRERDAEKDERIAARKEKRQQKDTVT